MQLVDIHCPICQRLLLRRFEGFHVQASCRHCKLEVTVKRKEAVPTAA
jgi:phage FluMu protein Com